VTQITLYKEPSRGKGFLKDDELGESPGRPIGIGGDVEQVFVSEEEEEELEEFEEEEEEEEEEIVEEEEVKETKLMEEEDLIDYLTSERVGAPDGHFENDTMEVGSFSDSR
jgi:hypothetical protein